MRSVERVRPAWVAVVWLLASAVRAPAQSGPVMEIEPEVHDFGGVRQGQNLEHTFTVMNTGSEPLEIRRISTSCGCAAAVPRDHIVAPGETTSLHVTLQTRKYKGVIEKSISVASNDARRVRTVRVKAFVEVPEEK